MRVFPVEAVGRNMRDHTKLRVFELADALAVEIYKITALFPKTEIYGLTSQMRRAAVSIPSNIVEGCARATQKEYVQFLQIAFGSLRELHYQLNLSGKLGYCTEPDYSHITQRIIETEKVLNALIRSLYKLSCFKPSVYQPSA